jgi:23S rRNA (guanosine2251-2'-O)-methyltransferase
MSRRRYSQHHRKDSPPPRREGGAHAPRRDAPPQGEFIMGRNCLEEVMKRAPGRLLEVYIAESRDEVAHRSGGRRADISERLRELRVPVREVSRRDLESIVNSDSHQGVVARVSPRSYLSFDDLVESVRESDTISILALDGVLDPQNFGAILRAAECFGINAVLWSKNRGAPIGPVVSKVSVGASELVPLCVVSNLHRALEQLKEAGAWIAGTMIAPDATPLDTFEFPEKSVVVMGAEGEGIHQLIEKGLDFKVYLSMAGAIDSLNVSQATAVFLHELAKQRRQKQPLKVT